MIDDSTITKSCGNIFLDLGFSREEAAELTAKSEMISAVSAIIRARKLTQKEAAKICSTDQPTLSKILRGYLDSITIDRLAAWLGALGRPVEIHMRPYSRVRRARHIRVIDHCRKPKTTTVRKRA